MPTLLTDRVLGTQPCDADPATGVCELYPVGLGSTVACGTVVFDAVGRDDEPLDDPDPDPDEDDPVLDPELEPAEVDPAEVDPPEVGMVEVGAAESLLLHAAKPRTAVVARTARRMGPVGVRMRTVCLFKLGAATSASD